MIFVCLVVHESGANRKANAEAPRPTEGKGRRVSFQTGAKIMEKQSIQPRCSKPIDCLNIDRRYEMITEPINK